MQSPGTSGVAVVVTAVVGTTVVLAGVGVGVGVSVALSDGVRGSTALNAGDAAALGAARTTGVGVGVGVAVPPTPSRRARRADASIGDTLTIDTTLSKA